MKKKIAVFATGWSSEILHHYLRGIIEGFASISADIYLFTSFPSLGDPEEFIRGELNIFKLPNLKDFDVACIIANGLNFPGLIEELCGRCDEAGIPVIFTGHDDNVHYFVGADNYAGARDLAEHLVTEHQAKDFFFIAGCSDNDDSNARLLALKDVLAAHDIPFGEDRVFYSDWSSERATVFLLDWLKKGQKLPDVLVCANDNLAMTLCTVLRDHGILVPRDILVTGFDNEYSASIYDPSISSVNQRFDKIGHSVAKLALRLLDGETCEQSQTIPCEFIPSESCGCTTARDFNGMRRELGRNLHVSSTTTSNFHRYLANMERTVFRGRTYANLKDNLSAMILDTFQNFEGDSFHIVLDPLYEESILDSGKHLRGIGYPPEMNILFSMDEQILSNTASFQTADIVPFIKDTGKNHFFVCMPLHNYGDEMGYAIFVNCLDKFSKTTDLQMYLDRMNNILSKYRQMLNVDSLNRKLIQLSETDALTHVKNRTAYQTRKEELELTLQSRKDTPFSILLCDINNLKKINDSYGHEAGDEYILNSCKLICNIFKHSAIYRIGGDEFAVILTGTDHRHRRELLADFQSRMEKLQDPELPACERVSIASGLADYDPRLDTGVDTVLHRADLFMYENKQDMKNAR